MVGLFVAASLVCGGQPGYLESIDNYERRELRGFTLMINEDLIDRDGALLDRVLLQLEHDLDGMTSFLGDTQLEMLRESTVWIERQGATVPGGMSGRGMCFHPSAAWLTSHGLLAEKEGGVEIIKAEDFPDWRRNQPFMTFHEFAHAYHWRIGFERADVKAAYDEAMQAGLYDAVDYNMAADGRPVRAYAANNDKEYFAELSEAYFGLNDYFPFTRRQLKEHDPRGYALIERLWTLTESDMRDGEAPQ